MNEAPRFVVLLLLAAVLSGTGAAAQVEQVTVSLELVVHPTEAAALTRCVASRDLTRNETSAWWVVLSPGEDGLEMDCGNERASGLEATPRASDGDLVIRTAATLRTRSRPGDSHLEVELSSQTAGEEAASSVRQRDLYFDFDRRLIVPAFVAGPEERDRLGLHDVFVRVEVLRDKELATEYSSLAILSRSVGARILLDGGVVGSVREGGLTTIAPVRTGERLIALQDDSGNGMTRMVQVQAGRLAMVELETQVPELPAFALETLGPNAQGFEEYLRLRDGGVVIRIPAGEFLMGNKETERQPLEHMVYVSEFLIDKTEVTWAQYKKFAAATGRSLPPIEPYWGIHDDHAVVFVNWEESKAHCEWAGARLATEAEWEKAARGTDGRKFPWGNSEPTRDLAVYRRGWGFTATDPATAHPDAASPYGALDMGGSLWEWCADWYQDEYYEVSPARDPRGPTSGLARVVRGGSWDSRPDVLSASCRSWGHRGYREGDFGFRCAMDTP